METISPEIYTHLMLKPNSVKVPAQHRKPQDRQRSIEWAKSWIEGSDDFVILDTESNGFGNKATILHIAIVSREGKELLDLLVRPTQGIADNLIEEMGVDWKVLGNAPRADELNDQVTAVLQNKSILTFNSEFRERIFDQTGFNPQKMTCVMIPFSQFIGEWHPKKSDYKYQPLPKPGGGWNALDDCKTTLDLLHLMASHKKAKPWWQVW